jgi:hypothetical protein
MTTIAEKHINSSLASVLTATSPIIVFLGSVLIGLEQFKLKSVLGLILGFRDVKKEQTIIDCGLEEPFQYWWKKAIKKANEIYNNKN